MLFDTHAHLDDPKFTADLPDILARASSSGVTRIMTVGTDAESSRKACDIAARTPGVIACIGSHPHTADTVTSVDALEPLVPQARAIGETGLDYAKGFSTPENQKRLFEAHLDLSRRSGLPVVIHCREAHTDCRAMLRSLLGPVVRGIIHCFSGTADDARDYLDLGLHLSIAGPITYPNAHALRETVRGLPLDRLLLETDCPYLAPQRWRGKRNEPSYVTHTAETIAELLRVPVETVAENTTCNAQTLLQCS